MNISWKECVRMYGLFKNTFLCIIIVQCTNTKQIIQVQKFIFLKHFKCTNFVVREHKTPRHISGAWMENNAKQPSHSQVLFGISVCRCGGKKLCLSLFKCTFIYFAYNESVWKRPFYAKKYFLFIFSTIV